MQILTKNIPKIEKADKLFISKEIAVSYNEIPIQAPLKLHNHDFYELVLINKGQGTHFTKSNKYPIRAGDIFLIKPNEAHGYSNTKELNLTNIFYIPDKLQLPIADLKEFPGYHAFFEIEPQYRDIHGYKSRLRLSLEELKNTQRLITNIKQQLTEHPPGFRFLTFSYFIQLIFLLSQYYENSNTAHSNLLLQLGKVTTYIENNYTQSITLDELAKVGMMSKRTLIRKFKNILNRTPIDYLLNLRVAKASSLLNSNLNISEVAAQCGFDDSNYFSRQFKKITGLSPRNYIKK